MWHLLRNGSQNEHEQNEWPFSDGVNTRLKSEAMGLATLKRSRHQAEMGSGKSYQTCHFHNWKSPMGLATLKRCRYQVEIGSSVEWQVPWDLSLATSEC